MSARPKLLIVGIDGLGLDLVEEAVARGELPFFRELMAAGTRAPLRSTTPPTTLPAWTSFLTGASPSSHGIPDFTLRTGYRVRFVGARDRRLPTLFAHLERHGLTAGAAWFPTTYPPEPLAGYQISGWDSPVTAEGDASFVHPAALHAELLAEFGGGHLAFAAVDELRGGESWRTEAAEALPRHVERRAEIAAWLLAHRPVDVAAFYFGELDTAAHHFWPFRDPSSPRRPPEPWDPALGRALDDVLSALDAAMARLARAAGPEVPLIVLSDHGSAGASDLALHLNSALAAAGLLAFRRGPHLSLRPTAVRSRAPALVPRALRRRLFRWAGGLWPGRIESHLRFGAVDFGRTIAFSEELPYAPAVWLNQLGREPAGILPRSQRERAALAVERALADVRAEDGTILVRRVIRREELHHGPYAHLFPDLVVELECPGGHVPVCLPSIPGGPATSRVPPAEHLGRKGRSLPGCHSPLGILLARGPGIAPGARIEARLEDVAPLAAALVGAPPAPWFERTTAVVTAPIPLPARPAAYSPAEERAVAERLRRLGYLER